MKTKYLAAALLIALFGCVNAQNNISELHSSSERELTAGIVQREIKHGMSQADVAESLGSPNIVSRDESGMETWIYDKIATEASYSNSQGSIGGLAGIAGGVGSVLLLGLGSGSYDKQAGASATTQKTLTVVIKYDRRSLVDSATFHSSRF